MQKCLNEDAQAGFRGFSLHYQPYVDGQNNIMIGFEALARYRDAQGDNVSPEEFIGILEKMQLIVQFGRWVIDTALRDLHRFQHYDPHYIMNINIAHGQIQDSALFDYIMERAHVHHVAVSTIELEFTEHFFVHEYQQLKERADAFQEQGGLIAMDDFGIGYSSLGFLKNMHVDVVKVDKIFVRDILYDKVQAFFLEWIIKLCHKLHHRVIIEGIETEEEYNLVCKLGIDMVQGYYYSRPYCFEKIAEFVKRHQLG